jgi:outer membrane protein TolC
MPRPLFTPPVALCRLLVPCLGLVFLPQPLPAGNKSGAGWQQAPTKPKVKVKPKPAPKARPIDEARGPQGPASAPALPAAPRRTALDEETIQRRIPVSGPLDEDALILLAIANNPELARRRAEILIARAKVKGAGDWENPELRIGYAWDRDDRLTEPFMERATERITANERYSSTENERNLATGFEPFAGDAQTQRRDGSVRTSRYRTIERRVTPGRYRDVIDTTVYERRNARESYSQNTDVSSQGASFNTREGVSQNSDRRIVERSREIINHPDEYSRDDELSILIRFRIPNPWERRANIELAAAETARAESDYLIEEDKVIREVRALYEDLNILESIGRSTASRQVVQEKYRADLEALNSPELADLAADIRVGVGRSMRDQRELRSDIARSRQELADLCGIDRPERIAVIGKPSRRVVPVDSLDINYLVSMAQLHRSDLLDLEARLLVAKAELKVARSARIPFFSFADAGWSTATTSGRTGESEEWAVRVGITLPFFDWFGINKAHLEHQTATEAYTRQVGEQRQRITREIMGAIARIRTAAAELVQYDKDFARIKADSVRTRQQMSQESDSKRVRSNYQSEDLVSKFEEDRYEVWSDYYKAVMALEHALGTRLERVLSR